MRWAKISIKRKIFLCLAVFSVCIVVVLWLLQTVFLESSYKFIKKSEVRAYSQSIVDNIDSESLDDLLGTITESGNICVHLIDQNGEQIKESGKFRYCSIHEMDAVEKAALFSEVGTGGTKMLSFFQSPASDHPKSEQYSWKDKSFGAEQMQESIAFFQIAVQADGTPVMVSINARITPLNTTVETLRTQIVWISVLFFLLAGVLALWMSRFIAKPIEDINQSSKELANGNYDVAFNGHGYREITELSNTLNVTAQALSRSDQLRKELVANVSHDLRTPLTMIIGYSEVMRDIPSEITPENVQIIIDEAQRLNLLVNDLLDLSQIEAGARKLDLQRFDLTACIRETLSRYQKLIEQQGYVLTFEAEGEAWVRADQVKIQQVIYNLINNAVDFTGARKTVLVRQTATASEVRIDVMDYGAGISPKEIETIWERYYSKNKTGQRMLIGTGLGLSIVQAVLRLHGAAFGVESEIGKGSDFWFILPKDRHKDL